MAPKRKRYISWIIKVTKKMTYDQKAWPKELQQFFLQEIEDKANINLRGVFFPKDKYSSLVVHTSDERTYNVYAGEYVVFNKTSILNVIDEEDFQLLYEKVG